MTPRIWLEAGAIVAGIIAIFGHNVAWDRAPYAILVCVGVIAAVELIARIGAK